MRTNGFGLLLLAGVVLAAFANQGSAQTIILRQKGNTNNKIQARLGDTIEIEAVADLQSVSASGYSLFITIPDGPFQVVDQGFEGQVGIQPFLAGPLFVGAGVNANAQLPETDDAGAALEGLQLEFAQVVGIDADRGRRGSGVVATFKLLCVRPVLNGPVRIDDSPIRETRLVLPDGSEAHFRTTRGMEITVVGLEVRDIPDVILLPGVADDRQIGSLDLFVSNSFSPIDSLRWSFEGTNLDSLDIQIDPVTRRVTVTPLFGWSGRRRIIWTVTEPTGLLPGEAPLSATDFSDIIVNNPPSFVTPRDPDGVKRDTLRLTEDVNNYIPGATSPDVRRAFVWEDLDFLVDDPDVIDKQLELLFAVLTFGAASDTARVIGEDSATTHELLVWTRPDFAGVDSLRILVNDGLRGQDTLVVVIEVAEVPDAPRFIIQDPSIRISRGGSKSVLLDEFVFDPDTPLDSLIVEWDDDPGDNFTVELEEEDGLRQLVFRGKSGFIGDGLFVFRAIDPADPDLNDRIVINITASEKLPPVVAPIRELKIDLTPPGIVVDNPKPIFSIVLDDLVEDPDNQDSELAWSIPFLHQSQIDIDENRALIVQAPLGFVGYEGITFTVTDPDGQTDVLLARIYSSDRRPVAGGLPDLVLQQGEVHRKIGLDNYYFDADNINEEMDWETVDHTNTDLSVTIDPITHITTFVVATDAAFASIPVIFRVTSRPEGISALDTMFVAITSDGSGGTGGGGGGGGAGAIQILPFPSDLQIPIERFTDVFNLDDFIITPPDIPIETITWDVRGGLNSIPQIGRDNTVSIFGFSSGLDTLFFTARDTLGRTQEVATTVRVVGEKEFLNLHSIPDVNFIAGQVFNDLNLNNFVIDRVTHPDSVLVWSIEFIAPDNNIFVQVNPDTTIFATAPDTGETEVVLTVRNTVLEVVGRDTVRVTSLSPDLVQEPLQDLAPVGFKAGQVVISVSLNDHLPTAFLPTDGSDPNVKWSVSGQNVSQPINRYATTPHTHAHECRGKGGRGYADLSRRASRRVYRYRRHGRHRA